MQFMCRLRERSPFTTALWYNDLLPLFLFLSSLPLSYSPYLFSLSLIL